MTVYRIHRKDLPDDEEYIGEDYEVPLSRKQETERRRRLEAESEDTADRVRKAMEQAEG